MYKTPVSEQFKDAGDGNLVLDFVNSFASLTGSTVAGDIGEPINLQEWQEDLIRSLYARDDEGRRLFRQALIGVGRKNGKSFIAACLALYELFLGPAGGEIYSVAGSRDQALIVFNHAKQMIKQAPELEAACEIRVKSIYIPSTNSVYQPLSTDYDGAEGKSPTFVIFDEVHTQPHNKLWNALRLGSGARKEPLMIGITTAGVKIDSQGNDSLCYTLYNQGVRTISGEAQDPTFYFEWWEPKNKTADYRSPAVWQEANPGFGVINTPAHFESVLQTVPEAEFRTKHLNQWVSTLNAWLPTGAWEDCADADRRDVEASEPVVLGLDGSWHYDSTALVGCTLDGYLFLVQLWERPDDDPSWRVPLEEVNETVRKAFARYNVQHLIADTWSVNNTIPELESLGYPIISEPASTRRMVKVTAKAYEGITTGHLSHDGNPALARHFSNCVLKQSRDGHYITKESKASSRKIDAAMAAVLAYDLATSTVQEPERTFAIY